MFPETWNWLKRRIRGPGEPVIDLPGESLAGQERINNYLTEMEEFLNDDEARVLAIYGMGGIGKTTLLRKFSNHLVGSNSRRKFDHIIFIEVSAHPRMEKIQRDIKKQIGRNLSSLRKKRFLLLLDDVWERVDLLKMGIPLPSKENKCKVILTTRDKSYCRIRNVDANNSTQFLEMALLSEFEAWNFFESNVGRDLDQEVGEIIILAKNMVKRCGGLPLALRTVGKSMGEASSVKEWRNAERNLIISPDQIKRFEKEVLHLLKYSFDQLQNDGTRDCFLYCCLFKEDEGIQKESLIDYWFGEGFLDCGHSESLHDALHRGHENIKRFISSGLLQEGLDNRYVRMHAVFRAMCLWLTSGKFDKYGKFYTFHGEYFSDIVPHRTLRKIHRLSLKTNQHLGERTLPKEFILGPNLETLLCEGGFHGDFPINISFQNCSSLRVLKLRYCVPYFELKKLISCPELRYLDLSFTKLKKLPDEVGFLYNLVYLNLSWNEDLEALPNSIINLGKLQKLDLSHIGLKEIPSIISSLANLEILSLSDTSKLEIFPDSLKYPLKLRILDLGGTQIQYLPNSIYSLSDLRKLCVSKTKLTDISLLTFECPDLSYNILQSLPNSIGALTMLCELDLSKTKLSTLPDSIGKLRHLEKLLLSQSTLKYLPNSIGNLVNLRQLDLGHCELECLPDSIGALTKLRELDLSETRLSTLPYSIGNLRHLEKLLLSQSTLKYLPNSIGNLVNLRQLDLGHCELKSLPDSIGALTKLRVLDLSKTRLLTLPISIGKLRHLKRLLLWKSTLKYLPNSIGNLLNLRQLDLGHCKLERLPDSIGALTMLWELDLSETRISTLPDSIGNLRHLEKLLLSQSTLKYLPNSIGNLVNLRKLDLGHCELANLPDSIGALTMLQELNLSQTRLSTLPNSIGNLRHLEKLLLWKSTLKYLPNSIGNLANLRQLDLGHCELESLPDSIGSLTMLWELDLSKTRVSTLPKSIRKLSHLEKFLFCK